LLSFGTEYFVFILLLKNIKIQIYRTTFLPVAGCETWSLTLKNGRRLRLFENTVLRKIFGAQRDEVTGEWRTIHNEELYDLYCLPNIVRVTKTRRMRWAGHVARMGEMRGAYRVLVGKPLGKRPLGRLNCGGRIILKWIFKKWDGAWNGLIWLRTGTSDGVL